VKYKRLNENSELHIGQRINRLCPKKFQKAIKKSAFLWGTKSKETEGHRNAGG
jgi:hypothetical protein